MSDKKWQVFCFNEVSSTNDVALEYSHGEKGQKIAVRALSQTAGRGRRGRSWQSLQGNLFVSLLLEFDIRYLGRLVVTASLSLYEVIKELQNKASVCLKWPNDVLLNNAKVSGMLLEKGEGDYVVVGVGVNIAQSPESANMLYPTTSLAEAGIQVSAEEFLERYLQKFDENMQRNFSEMRQKWQQNAIGLNKEILIKQNDHEEKGFFRGLDDNANLLLETASGLKKIMAGDVFLVGK